MSEQKCQAKDPTTCPYHGAQLKLQHAIKTGDTNEYLRQRTIIADQEKKKEATNTEMNLKDKSPYTYTKQDMITLIKENLYYEIDEDDEEELKDAYIEVRRDTIGRSLENPAAIQNMEEYDKFVASYRKLVNPTLTNHEKRELDLLKRTIETGDDRFMSNDTTHRILERMSDERIGRLNRSISQEFYRIIAKD